MDIRPPYGYREIVPLSRSHRVVLPGERVLPPALPLSFAEFVPAARDHPIVFVPGNNGRTFLAMVVFGIENRQNLFADADGRWDAMAYLPAYVRRYPLCMSRGSVEGREQPECITCVEKRALAESGQPLYDEKGEPLLHWEERRKLLFESRPIWRDGRSCAGRSRAWNCSKPSPCRPSRNRASRSRSAEYTEFWSRS